MQTSTSPSPPESLFVRPRCDDLMGRTLATGGRCDLLPYPASDCTGFYMISVITGLPMPCSTPSDDAQTTCSRMLTIGDSENCPQYSQTPNFVSGVDEAESGIPRSICDYRCSIGQIPPGRYQLLVGQVKHVLHKYRLSISGTHADKTMIATEGASMTFYASKCWTLAAESDEGPHGRMQRPVTETESPNTLGTGAEKRIPEHFKASLSLT